eukprot:COSAG01_NODE_2679_length_7257_cov_144.510056_6_plen_58_part_00
MHALSRVRSAHRACCAAAGNTRAAQILASLRAILQQGESAFGLRVGDAREMFQQLDQ